MRRKLNDLFYRPLFATFFVCVLAIFPMRGFGEAGGAVGGETYSEFKGTHVPTAIVHIATGEDLGAYPISTAPLAVQKAMRNTLYFIAADYYTDDQTPAHIKISDFKLALNSNASLSIVNNEERYQILQSAIYKNSCVPYKDDMMTCPYIKRLTECTAFAIDHGRSLWTARHCMDMVRQSINMKNNNTTFYKTVSYVIFVFDNSGNIVAGPLSWSDLGLDEHSPIMNFNWSILEVHDDYVVMPLAHPISKYLEVGPLVANEELYNIGNPSTTAPQLYSEEDWSHYGRPQNLNGDDGQLRFSRGLLLGPDASKILQVPLTDLKIVASQSDTILTSSDSLRGYSGGPIVDQNGRVVAIVSSGSTAKLFGNDQNGLRTLTIGVRPPEWH